jgi:NAD(P)-dependent dehydrogenase (short-subunit alcohol dehydrogenase family)
LNIVDNNEIKKNTRLNEKVVVITGAGSGIGKGIALLFAASGAKVVAADWDKTSLDKVVSEVLSQGGIITGVQTDVSNKDQDIKLINTAISTYGKLDVLINNAGIMDNMAPAGEFDQATLEKVIGVNSYGPLYLINAALPHFLAQGKGVIVNTASIAGIGGGAAGVAYTMSKHAMIGLSQNTAWMYASQGIRCNAMAVGGVKTGIMENTIDKVAPINPASIGLTRAGAWASMAPSFGEPLDIAYLALYLASDESKFVNGSIISIDAGWSAA